ncbi:putative polysaccharide biosynthesis protein [Clostridium oryzae]|uniref:Stage V sporulation protein B n=1 Tax=Clostridium oryzae TaxID=1450648 RepID=A0A1V4INM1_9CLOT|nr:polysaccharide biosynthesis protein [Clostridium oryzae]OPJ61077.1 stage V sporulation protein B [Clostridium oryzae]
MVKQSLIKGTVILGITGVFVRFLGLFFRWPIIMLIGDEGIGYYQMTYPLYMFFIGVASGMPVAISKMISENNAINDRAEMFEIINKAMLVMIILGGGFSLAFILFPAQIIKVFNWDTKTVYSLIGIGAAPVFIGIMSVYRGFFQGMQNMIPTSISQLIEQLGRVIFGVGLAFLLLPKGIEFSAGGAAFGAAAGGILGSFYLYIKFRKIKKSITFVKRKKDHKVLTQLLNIAIPISLGTSVGTIMNLIDSILLPQKLLQAGYSYKEATILYGQLTGKAMVLINVPLTLSIALSSSLIPIIAEAVALKKRMELINKVETSIKLSMVIALPSTCGLFFLAYPILALIFPGHSGGDMLLRYSSLIIPFIILTQISTALLQGTGHYNIPIKNLLIGCIFKIVITILIVPIKNVNIYGAVIGTLVAYFITSLLNMIALHRRLGITVNYYDIVIKPAYASVIMTIGVVFMYQYVYNYTISNAAACITSVLSGGLLYVLMMLLFGVFKYQHQK